MVYAGLDEDKFWSMTIGEVVRWIDGLNKRHKKELQEIANMSYTNTMILLDGVGMILSGKGEVPDIYESYPDLFDEELKRKEQIRKSIANFRNFANNFNKKFKRGD